MTATIVGPGGKIEVENEEGNPIRVADIGKLVPEAFDEISLSYTGADLTTVIYKLASVVIATVNLGYTGSNLTSVVRS